MHKYLIIDLDETTCVTPYYKTLNDFQALDHVNFKPKKKVIKYLSKLVERKKLIPLFVTARCESLRDATSTWIMTHADDLFTGDNLLMRPIGNIMESFDLKDYLLKDWEILPSDILLWVDDHHPILQKGNEMGYCVVHPDVIETIVKIEGL